MQRCAQERDIARAYADGETTTSIAKRFGVCPTTATRIAERHGVALRGRGSRGRPCVANEAEIAAAYAAGDRVVDISSRFGIATSTATRVAERCGTEKRQKSRRYLNADEQREVTERYSAGEKSTDIATRFGTDINTVRLVAKRNGTKTRKRGSPFRGSSRLDVNGYRWVSLPRTDPLYAMTSSGTGQVPEHRLVVARKLGRPLTRGETVHHINGVRDDNRPENLQLRKGAHGKGVVLCCRNCGSDDIIAMHIAEE